MNQRASIPVSRDRRDRASCARWERPGFFSPEGGDHEQVGSGVLAGDREGSGADELANSVCSGEIGGPSEAATPNGPGRRNGV